ncbi:LexA family transcriptional regulator [Sphingomonas citri]|uniref:LexA family transcriptional regulator n=1 Tax=Sphingomonas citri TaxID=2862499 RepID=UPI001CA5B884|nr:LexA family transcriptional regulator [Sphingomonas citri]
MASGNNIQRFREERGWSRPELGKRMNTSGQQVERLEKAQRRLTQDWIERAARALGVEPVDIIAPDRGEVPDQPVARSLDAGETVEIIRLDLSLPMGPGASVDDYVEEEPLRFDLGYVQAFTRTPAHRLRLAHGVGDSMFPTLLNSDLVWIDSTQNTLNQADKVWAVSINGAAAIKRLRPLREGKVLVISDNPTIENYEVAADELRIGGRVIRFARDL